MGIHRGPNIIKDGLVFGYDTGYGVADNNTATRFYPGENTVNILPSGPAIGTGDFSRQAAHNESFTYSKITNYRGRADVHKLYINPTGNTADPYADFGGQYHKSGGSAVGDVYALSFDFYVAKGNNPPGLSTSYGNGYKSPSSSGAASLGTNIDVDLGDGWTRRTRIATITTAGNTWWRFGCNTNGNETEVYIDNVQIELKSHATPFVDGTRSSTQSLIDLKRTTDIDVSNVSFDSTGQPDFDGTSDYINITNYTQHQSSTGTIEAVVKLDTISGNRYIFGAGGTSTYGASRALRVNSGNWGIVTYGSANEDWGTGVAASTTDWQHVAFGWDGTTVYFYINGVRTSTVRSGLVTPLGSVLRVGMPPWGIGSASDGEIPIIKHYSRVLTEAEMKQNYNAYKNRFNI